MLNVHDQARIREHTFVWCRVGCSFDPRRLRATGRVFRCESSARSAGAYPPDLGDAMQQFSIRSRSSACERASAFP
jgi:hypothetical protein